MSDHPLRSKTEQEIHARYRSAPAYYLQAKLERKRALERRRHPRQGEGEGEVRGPAPRAPADGEVPRDRVSPPPGPSVAPPSASGQSSGTGLESRPEAPESRPNDLFSDAVRDGSRAGDDGAAARLGPRAENLELALPGLEILDAALAECDYRDDTDTPGTLPRRPGPANPALTQGAILEAVLDDYGNWPFLSEPGDDDVAAIDPHVAAWFEPGADPEPGRGDDRRSRLELVGEPRARPRSDLEARLQRLLDSEPELDLVLDADPEFEEAFAWETESGSENAGLGSGDFGNTGVHTVRVVSVARDRRRPNMVRIVRETSRISG